MHVQGSAHILSSSVNGFLGCCSRLHFDYSTFYSSYTLWHFRRKKYVRGSVTRIQYYVLHLVRNCLCERFHVVQLPHGLEVEANAIYGLEEPNAILSPLVQERLHHRPNADHRLKIMMECRSQSLPHAE